MKRQFLFSSFWLFYAIPVITAQAEDVQGTNPNMSPEIQSAIIQVLGGLIGGFLIAYLTLTLQKERKVIEYQISSMPLLRFHPKKERPLIVSVNKSILTNQPADKGKFEPVEALPLNCPQIIL